MSVNGKLVANTPELKKEATRKETDPSGNPVEELLGAAMKTVPRGVLCVC